MNPTAATLSRLDLLKSIKQCNLNNSECMQHVASKLIELDKDIEIDTLLEYILQHNLFCTQLMDCIGEYIYHNEKTIKSHGI